MSGPITVLLTRPKAQSERFAQALADAGNGAFEVLISSVLTIRARISPPAMAGVSGVILSSENAARVLAGLVDVAGVVAYCVGDRTARVAGELGMVAHSAGGDAEALIAMVRAAAPKGELLHAHGQETRGDVAARLAASGINTRSAVIYDQIETPLSAAAQQVLAGRNAVILPLFSPRSAKLVSAAAADAVAPLVIVSLSPAVAAAWAGPAPVKAVVADQPNATEMCDIIVRLAAAMSP